LNLFSDDIAREVVYAGNLSSILGSYSSNCGTAIYTKSRKCLKISLIPAPAPESLPAIDNATFGIIG
jgi:hypothetical protein